MHNFVANIFERTTSACAENTAGGTPSQPQAKNYLRVRGEYINVLPDTFKAVELPPRARRIRKIVNMHKQAFGTTSACAENTGGQKGTGVNGGNYLRVRGEYWDWMAASSNYLELPPRARRIPGCFA